MEKTIIKAEWDYNEYIEQGRTVYDKEDGEENPDYDLGFANDLIKYLDENFNKETEEETSKKTGESKVDIIISSYSSRGVSIKMRYESYTDDWPPLEVPDREKVRIEISSTDRKEMKAVAEKIKNILPWAFEVSE